MRPEVCSFLRGKRNTLDINGVSLDFTRETRRDPWSIPTDLCRLDLHFMTPGIQWMDQMDGPPVHTDQLFAHGLSYVSGVIVRLTCDSIPEPQDFKILWFWNAVTSQPYYYSRHIR